jgi:RimJ/RimL family protein N-acetyltransferase
MRCRLGNFAQVFGTSFVIGTEMRAAVLAFAFDGLGADVAVTGAYPFAVGSLRVSEKLGNEVNRVRRDRVRGEGCRSRLQADARDGDARDRPEVQLEGLD